MKKLGMLGLIVGSLWLGSCSDDDKDFMLDVNRMTGVDWYYNRTTSKNYSSFSDENVLEINRFDKSGEIKGIDLRGVIEWQERGGMKGGIYLPWIGRMGIPRRGWWRIVRPRS